jgi:hypothetical protein
MHEGSAMLDGGKAYLHLAASALLSLDKYSVSRALFTI